MKMKRNPLLRFKGKDLYPSNGVNPCSHYLFSQGHIVRGSVLVPPIITFVPQFMALPQQLIVLCNRLLYHTNTSSYLFYSAKTNLIWTTSTFSAKNTTQYPATAPCWRSNNRVAKSAPDATATPQSSKKVGDSYSLNQNPNTR